MLPSRWLIVQQAFPDLGLVDVEAEAYRQLEASDFAGRLRPGATVAVGVGSRGISNIAAIVHGAVRYWQDHAIHPFIVPAMGSHGAATADGQAHVLAHFGITEATMGCPVVSRLEVVSLGKTDDGIEALMDAAAHAADAVMPVGRVKWHTNFIGRVESGLLKMLAIGFGKFAGARMYHAHAQRLGLEHVILTVGRQVLRSGKIIGGLAILEDAHHRTARLEAVPADRLESREPELLALAKSWMATLPCDLDVLIVDEMGKNISGTGMDAKVVNRGTKSEYNPWPGLPTVERIFVRGLAPLSFGSAVGIGLADVTTDRLVAQIDWEPTLVNALAAGSPARVRLPMHFATDRECLSRVVPTVGRLDPADVTYGWIRNTLELDRLAVSENLRAAVERHPRVAIEREADAAFDADGNLVSGGW
jgi:hypothetical protein